MMLMMLMVLPEAIKMMMEVTTAGSDASLHSPIPSSNCHEDANRSLFSAQASKQAWHKGDACGGKCRDLRSSTLVSYHGYC